jgi:chorismate mutase
MKQRILFSGPCSAETEEQVMDTAKQIVAIDKQIIFRAGIWKPRTRPNAFEGLGEAALPWLQQVKAEYGMKTATEVANAKHVEAALKHDVDVLWIGARTTVNPFSVQEIADALKGTSVCVFIKNPVNPDIQLWIGAVERIQNAGISDIGLIHRGFGIYNKSEFRNEPMWQIPIDIKMKFTHLPMVCDISHISGKRDKLMSLAQKAADLDFDGLMIETHTDPDKAWSDAEQQVTPMRLKEMLDQLIWRQQQNHQSIDTPLHKMREEINTLDDNILELIGKRMAVAEDIGLIKKKQNMPILQIGRWHEILNQSVAKGNQLGLSNDFINKYLDAIHIESINKQNKVMSH